jgi:hypothetical protein
MLNILENSPVLAEYALGRSASYYLRTANGTRETVIFILVVASLISLWFLMVNWDRLIKGITPVVSDSDMLFNELCHAHQLSRTEKSQLKHAIDMLHLDNPSAVFVNPHYLQSCFNKGLADARTLEMKLFGTVGNIES